MNDGTEVEGVIEAKRVTSWVSVGKKTIIVVDIGSF